MTWGSHNSLIMPENVQRQGLIYSKWCVSISFKINERLVVHFHHLYCPPVADKRHTVCACAASVPQLTIWGQCGTAGPPLITADRGLLL